MSVKVPAIFEDSSGTVARLTGELETFGSLTLTEREQVTGNPVTITNGSTGALTWDTKSAGSALLDLTAPDAPVVVVAGVYAVTVTCVPAAITAGGFYTLSLALDSAGGDANVEVASPASVAANTTPIVSASLTYYIPAGGVIAAVVDNEDGAASVDFTLQLGVVQAL